ncbi:2Fe-2S iron-sulfur cluster-binding protein, partial [Streptomyces sp. DSM 44915]
MSLTIDGEKISVPKGTLVIRAAELMGVQIPRFCDHPLLDPVGACRQCLVEVEGQRKPMASCTTPVSPVAADGDDPELVFLLKSAANLDIAVELLDLGEEGRTSAHVVLVREANSPSAQGGSTHEASDASARGRWAVGAGLSRRT